MNKREQLFRNYVELPTSKIFLCAVPKEMEDIYGRPFLYKEYFAVYHSGKSENFRYVTDDNEVKQADFVKAKVLAGRFPKQSSPALYIKSEQLNYDSEFANGYNFAVYQMAENGLLVNDTQICGFRSLEEMSNTIDLFVYFYEVVDLVDKINDRAYTEAKAKFNRHYTQAPSFKESDRKTRNADQWLRKSAGVDEILAELTNKKFETETITQTAPNSEKIDKDAQKKVIDDFFAEIEK